MINMKGEVKLNESHTGFLTLSSEGCTSWNRKWCKLSGSKLYFWNYPAAEQEDVSMILRFFL